MSCAFNFKTISSLRFSSSDTDLMEEFAFDLIVSISLASSSTCGDLALRLAGLRNNMSSSSALPWMAVSKGGLPRAEYDGTRTKLVRDRKLEDVTLS